MTNKGHKRVQMLPLGSVSSASGKQTPKMPLPGPRSPQGFASWHMQMVLLACGGLRAAEPSPAYRCLRHSRALISIFLLCPVQEVTEKSERITQLEQEKSALIKQLFEARARSNHETSQLDSTFI